ncbi:MAG: phospholipase A1, partial [Planctomycetota bacterium]
ESIDSAEAKFQVSFKIPIAQNILDTRNDVFFAFTTRAWWQAYNKDISSPFRETDYEPELFVRHYGGPKLGAIKIAGWDVGMAHQSNGKSGSLSRSWNRINANVAMETGNLVVGLRSWYRIPEDSKNDDNPDLHHYLGYGDVRVLYSRWDQVFTAMFRRGTKKGAFELTWSRPIWQQLRMYLTYFDGYGENLLDYNHHTRRIGFGFGLNDYIEPRGFGR